MVMPSNSAQFLAASGLGTEGGRRPTVVPRPEAASPELPEPRPTRRKFTSADKLRILKETDKAAGTGKIGSILRREGIYSSDLSHWRSQRDAGRFGGAPIKRGPKSEKQNSIVLELLAAKKKIVLLERRLDRAETIIEVQKKISELLGILPVESESRVVS